MRIPVFPLLLVLSIVSATQSTMLNAADAKPKTVPPVHSKQAKKKMELQKISYRKTGGFAGISKGVDLTVSSLSAEEQRELQRLFDEANLQKKDQKITPGAADVFYYWISATTTKGSYEVKYDDVSLPGDVRPLVQFLENKSTNMPR
jgi:hypothetical protein